jgi:hypothetical protein
VCYVLGNHQSMAWWLYPLFLTPAAAAPQTLLFQMHVTLAQGTLGAWPQA